MLTFITIVHVFLCVFMIFVILLQPGKDAGMGAALGGGAASSAFGGRGAVTFLSKVTGVCAALFFITSLGLSFVGLKPSVAGGADEEKPAAAAPATTPEGTPSEAAKATGAEGIEQAGQPATAAPVTVTPATPAEPPAPGAPAVPPAPAPASPAPAPEAPKPEGQK